jgi:ComF family protein
MCLHCKIHIPYVHNSELKSSNRLYQILNQRMDIEHATALCYFQEGSVTQSILHSIKYKGNKPLAQQMGREIAETVKSKPFSIPDILLPIPLHPRKRKLRGFNQSEEICKGMEEILKIPIEVDLLAREIHKESQTHLGRISRWKNISTAYVKGDKMPDYQHIAIVDDMITTGSTIEACYIHLKAQKPSLKISVYSLGFES